MPTFQHFQGAFLVRLFGVVRENQQQKRPCNACSRTRFLGHCMSMFLPSHEKPSATCEKVGVSQRDSLGPREWLTSFGFPLKTKNKGPRNFKFNRSAGRVRASMGMVFNGPILAADCLFTMAPIAIALINVTFKRFKTAQMRVSRV